MPNKGFTFIFALISLALAVPLGEPAAWLEDTSLVLLTAHNNARKFHGAQPLKWSEDLAQKARLWASDCNFAHSNGTLLSIPYGENMAAGTDDFSATSAVNAFLEEGGKFST